VTMPCALAAAASARADGDPVAELLRHARRTHEPDRTHQHPTRTHIRVLNPPTPPRHLTGMSAHTGLELRSLVKPDGTLELSLASVRFPEPAADEVVLRVDAAPINPSDLGVLFGAADLGAATVSGAEAGRVVSAPIPERAQRAMAGRIGKSLV